MSGRAARGLSDEDRILWNIVARTATPLKPLRNGSGDAVPFPAATAGATPQPPIPAPPAAPSPLDRPPAPPMPPYVPPVSAPRKPAGMALDPPTAVKLARGRLPLEARVDLHGLFQDEAYGLLLSFLRRAHAAGARHVLVITGKGSSSGGDGVLRRSVPGWLATAPFRDVVSGFDHAARGHGGAGALYVRLKRPA
jgi:DNA-nicking Smr family endonuclease